MGYYIETPGIALGKAKYLVDEDNAELIPQPLRFADIPDGMALICVVNNFAFEAAAYVFNNREFEEFTLPDDKRPKTWILMDLGKARQLSGFDATDGF